MKLVWTPRFVRAVRRLTRRQPVLLEDLAPDDYRRNSPRFQGEIL
jgi:hypothetical protein